MKKNPITGKATKKTAAQDAPEAQDAAPEQSEAEALRAELEAVKRELANAQAKKSRPDGALTVKASEKGCVCVYGLMRFPVSLYKSQWKRLFANKKNIEAFIKDNDEILPDKKAKAAK